MELLHGLSVHCILSREVITSMTREGSRDDSVVFTIPGDGTVEHIWE
jgi:hypothetical protein